MLGWNEECTSKRIKELLETMEIDLSSRSRCPKELSGGQQQRLEIIRVIATDPRILLMDEPFGAIDSITRGQLQDGCLRLQQKIEKTIVFVTHDIDEAVKLDDCIAILQEKAIIVQYEMPEMILTDPDNGFVEDFIGSRAIIKRLSLSRVSDIETSDWPVTNLADDPDEVRSKIQNSGKDCVLLLDEREPPKRWVNEEDLEQNGALLVGVGWPVAALVDVDSNRGMVDFDTVLEAIRLDAHLEVADGYVKRRKHRGDYRL